MLQRLPLFAVPSSCHLLPYSVHPLGDVDTSETRTKHKQTTALHDIDEVAGSAAVLPPLRPRTNSKGTAKSPAAAAAGLSPHEVCSHSRARAGNGESGTNTTSDPGNTAPFTLSLLHQPPRGTRMPPTARPQSQRQRVYLPATVKGAGGIGCCTSTYFLFQYAWLVTLHRANGCSASANALPPSRMRTATSLLHSRPSYATATPMTTAPHQIPSFDRHLERVLPLRPPLPLPRIKPPLRHPALRPHLRRPANYVSATSTPLHGRMDVAAAGDGVVRLSSVPRVAPRQRETSPPRPHHKRIDVARAGAEIVHGRRRERLVVGSGESRGFGFARLAGLACAQRWGKQATRRAALLVGRGRVGCWREERRSRCGGGGVMCARRTTLVRVRGAEITGGRVQRVVVPHGACEKLAEARSTRGITR
ncbi:hypothetical protein B0H11DRAFT_1942020 [Mycena galericulata]|nr:hypothetical protein B0H11DRAFT_1942020 [Mycena galericulata]